MSITRVCHLIDSHQDTVYFRSIARQHDRKKYPVAIGSIWRTGPLQSAMEGLGIPTFSLEAKGRAGYLPALVRLVRYLRTQKIGVLHAHCFDPTLLGLVAARMVGIPFVFTRHHSDHNQRLGKKWHCRIDAFCARFANHVIAVSEATREILVKVEKVPDGNITVVYNGMEPLVDPTPATVDALRNELGVGTSPVLLMVARLHEEKGHRYLFEALPHIEAEVGRTQVLLAGSGAEKGALEALAEEMGISERVRFLGRRNDVPALMALASVVVVPSLAESFGFVALEAMSLGRPVVASTTGGLPEVVGDAGIIVDQGDSETLARGIISIIRDQGLASCLGERGRARSQLFTFEQMIRGYEAVYGRVLAGPASKERLHGRQSAPFQTGKGPSG